MDQKLRNAYAGKTVLVTGHTGFKGGWLSTWLTELDARVVGYSLGIPTSPSLFEAISLGETIVDLRGDIRDRAGLESVFETYRPDYVFHLAAQSIVAVAYADPLNTISTNVIGTATLLDVIRNAKKSVVGVIVTSDKCYENQEWLWGYRESDQLGGKDPYSASKAAAEITFHSYVRSFFVDPQSGSLLASARAGNVIGGGDWAPNRIVPDCIRAWSKSQEVVLRSPDATRPWQHVLEPLSGYLKLAGMLKENPALNGESFNFGPKEERSLTVEDVVRILSDGWDGTYRTERSSREFAEAKLLRLSCDKAAALLDWTARLTAESAVKMTGSWYRHYYEDCGTSKMRSLTVQQIRSYAGDA